MPQASSNQSTDTRERILDAAIAAFAANGFRGSSINSIARNAGVNDVTVYRYFPRKRQLYWAAVDHKLSHSAALEKIVSTSSVATDPTTFLRLFIATSIDELNRDPALARLLNFTLLELDKEKNLLFRFYLRPIMQVLAARIADWISKGEIRAFDADAVAVAMIGSIISHYTFKLFGMEFHNTFTPQQLANDYADLCFAGLSPTATPKS